MTNFEKALKFVGLAEGGYTDNRNDRGNWTGGAVGKGELKGTNYGISAASYPHLDIKKLTKVQADAIYKKDYWDTIDGDNLSWPLALVAFDHAVNSGVRRAREALKLYEDPYVYIGARIKQYTSFKDWQHFGRGWANRMSDLIIEVSREMPLASSSGWSSKPDAAPAEAKIDVIELDTTLGVFTLTPPARFAILKDGKLSITLKD